MDSAQTLHKSLTKKEQPTNEVAEMLALVVLSHQETCPFFWYIEYRTFASRWSAYNRGVTGHDWYRNRGLTGSWFVTSWRRHHRQNYRTVWFGRSVVW